MKQWRQSRSLTQRELAQALNLSENFIRQIEAGTRDLPPSVLDVIPRHVAERHNRQRLRKAQSTVADLNTVAVPNLTVVRFSDRDPHPFIQFITYHGYENINSFATALSVRPRTVYDWIRSKRPEMPEALRLALAGLNQLRDLEKAIEEYLEF